MKTKFQKGTGCFTCMDCGKKTGDTGDNGAVRLCPLCEAKAECGNTLSDNTSIANPWKQFEDCTTAQQVYNRCDELMSAVN